MGHTNNSNAGNRDLVAKINILEKQIAYLQARVKENENNLKLQPHNVFYYGKCKHDNSNRVNFYPNAEHLHSFNVRSSGEKHFVRINKNNLRN